MAIDFSKNRDKDIEEITEKLFAKLQKQGLVAEEIGEQVGEGFADGLEHGFEDAASRIVASSLKINKAFKDLAKKITSQSISLSGLNIDFSDIDINEADFQKKINEVFEKFKIDNAIEFDSKTVEKQFKDMLGLHTKYAAKLSQLRGQSPKLTSQASIKANAQEQLAIVDGLREIQKILDRTSGMSIELPHVYFGDTKELRTTISLIEQMEKGEEKVGKQRDTNAEKIRKENKELRERNRILEEKVGPIEDGELPPARKPRTRKPKVETSAAVTGDSALQQLKRDAEAASKAFEEATNKLHDIYEAERQLDEQIERAGFVDYEKKIQSVERARENALALLHQSRPKKSAHKDNVAEVRSIVQSLIDKGALPDASRPSDLYAVNEYMNAVADYSKHTNESLNEMLAKVYATIDRKTQETIVGLKAGQSRQREQDPGDLIAKRKKLAEEHASATKAYNDAADAQAEAYKKLHAAEDGDNADVRAAEEKAMIEKEAAVAKRARLEEEARLQEEARRAEESRRAEEARLAKEREEAFNAELEAAVAAEMEEELKAEQTQLDLSEKKLKTEKEITKEKEKQYGYHAGKFRDDGFKAENLWQSTPGRSTGFYGTGTYMTDKDHLKEITTGQYGQRPLSVIDPDMYNLFDATNDKVADQLHQFLKSITNKAFGGKGENIKSLYAEFKALFPKEQVITYEDFKALVGELQQYVKDNKDNYPATKTMDSVSTKFMKSFGYEGIDTRGTKHADTTYGTVIYDLKEESIVLKEITDEMQKQEIVAGNIASVIEKQAGAQENIETSAEATRKHKFARTINGKSGKFSIKKQSYETDSGQMSMLPAVEAEVDAKNKLANANEKVAKSQKKIKEEVQSTQLAMPIDDILPPDGLKEMSSNELDEWLNGSDEAAASSVDTAPKVEAEAKAMDKVSKAADKAAGNKKKFAKANKEVAASVTPSVEGLETEADAMEDVGEAAKKTNRVISEEAKSAAESMSFSTRDYERLYDEMEAFAEHRKAENGYDLSRVSVNTDAHGAPLGATISYYKKATKETITETFKIDKAAQEAEEGVNRLVLSSRKATAGIADFEKATLQAINRQDQLIAQKNKTVSSLSAVLDPNSNRSLAGTDYEEEANKRIQAIKDEVAKLDQVDSAGERIILPEKDFLAIKRRIAELTQDARDFINQSKNAEYAPTQLESHSVSSGNKYRADQLKAQVENWKRAGIYVGDLKKKAEELTKSVTKITKHEDLKKYLEGMKEARALATLATQDKKAEASQTQELIKLQSNRNKLASQLSALDPSDTAKKSELIVQMRSAQAEYNKALAGATEEQGRELQAIQEKHRAQINLSKAAKKDSATKAEKAKDEAAIRQRQKQEQAYSDWWNKALFDREQQEKAKDARVIDARKKQEEAYEAWWQKALFDKERAPNLKYGKTTADSARRKLDATEGSVESLGVTNPEILAKLDVYREKVAEVERLRKQFADDPDAANDNGLVKQFQKAAYEAENARRGIKAVIDEEQRMMQTSAEQGFDPIELSADQIANLRAEMINFANEGAQGRVELKGWNDDNTKLYYTVTNSKGAVEEMTLALGQGTNNLYKYRTATKETGTLFEQVFKGIKVKAKELLSFVIGGGSVYKVIELFRQGIQYVREIDLALTELKKVTDETEETYDRFLETAAKTGARLGSTISAVTEATATFAKLGYTMEQATEMAESAIVYKNVGDNIASTEDAADSIISTMKGFKLEATESMKIVDRFNEVGNRFAITSQGIGEALRLSASALSEGGNSLDESIGLITAAM